MVSKNPGDTRLNRDAMFSFGAGVYPLIKMGEFQLPILIAGTPESPAERTPGKALTRLRIRSCRLFSCSDLYPANFVLNCIKRTLFRLNPNSWFRKFCKVRTKSPAPASSTSDKATCEAIKIFGSMRLDLPPAAAAVRAAVDGKFRYRNHPRKSPLPRRARLRESQPRSKPRSAKMSSKMPYC